MPRFDFLKRLAVSRLTLPLSIIIALPLWFLLAVGDADLVHMAVSIMPTVLTALLIHELNTRVILLRVNSQMLSCAFIILMGFAAPLHTDALANFVALVFVLVYMELFTLYQKPQPAPVTLAFALVSLLTMVIPGIIFFVPFCWLTLILLHAMTLRTALASIFGLVMPYWMVVGGLYAVGESGIIIEQAERLTYLHFFDYSSFTIGKIAFLVYIMVILLVGFVELVTSDYADKVRVKSLYQIASLHGFIALLTLVLLPHIYDEMVAIIIVDAALMGGHHIAQNYRQSTHIFFIVALVVGIAIAILNALMII